MNTPPLRGLHHVTAIAGDPQQNLDFYVGVMGMRLVKKSVNQDSPDTYHFFFADRDGTPGTGLTFFPWPGARPATPGAGKIVEVGLAVPRDSLSYWEARLRSHDVSVNPIEERFGREVLPFTDPDGMAAALVGIQEERSFAPWDDSPVPVEHQIRGLHSARILERSLKPTDTLLTRVMGFTRHGSDGEWHRYADSENSSGTIVELREVDERGSGNWGPGGIHHIAWRMQDDAEQEQLRSIVEKVGLRPSPQIDRFWFKSVYFREPGGALFELATDGPGYDRDEAPDKLGEKLILPPWMEERREQIEAALPDFVNPLQV